MRETRELATLPAEVALVPAHVQGTEEEHAVHNQRELVDVSHLNWVLGLDHFDKAVVDSNF